MRLALVTGASRGLGAAIVEAISSEADWETIAFVRNAKTCKSSRNTSYYTVDFAEPDASVQIISNLDVKKYSKLVFVSCAATIQPISGTEAVGCRSLQEAFAVNSLTPFLIASRLAWLTHETGTQFSIISISSGAAKRPIPGWAAYCGSKAAKEMLLNVIGVEYSHVTVQHIDPGVMDTGMQDEVRNSSCLDVDDFRRIQADGLLQSPVTVAQKVLLYL